jgi:hypothetical protein
MLLETLAGLAGAVTLAERAARLDRPADHAQDFQPVAAGAFETSAAQCAVESVTFADGSSRQPS